MPGLAEKQSNVAVFGEIRVKTRFWNRFSGVWHEILRFFDMSAGK
jgi:hypothetical protein